MYFDFWAQSCTVPPCTISWTWWAYTKNYLVLYYKGFNLFSHLSVIVKSVQPPLHSYHQSTLTLFFFIFPVCCLHLLHSASSLPDSSSLSFNTCNLLDTHSFIPFPYYFSSSLIHFLIHNPDTSRQRLSSLPMPYIPYAQLKTTRVFLKEFFNSPASLKIQVLSFTLKNNFWKHDILPFALMIRLISQLF